jgi:hypothetical protein
MSKWLTFLSFFLPFFLAFWRTLFRSAPRLGLKDERLLFVILVIVAGTMSANGVDALYCIVFVLAPYSMHRAFLIIDRELRRKKLKRKQGETLSLYDSSTSSNRKELDEEIETERKSEGNKVGSVAEPSVPVRHEDDA